MSERHVLLLHAYLQHNTNDSCTDFLQKVLNEFRFHRVFSCVTYVLSPQVFFGVELCLFC